MPSAPLNAELDTELRFFEKNRAEWLKRAPGKWALVKGEALVGTFDTAENAYIEGVRRFGNVTFLVKQILASDPVESSPALMLGVLNAHP
jgi:hypothetical protein